MHKDEVEGAGKQAKGALKDAVGGLTGNAKLQADGKLDKAEGKAQQKAGEVKDAVHDELKKWTDTVPS
ncbi:MAG: CsbD family protein [Candidatus Devosia euplotis]|nr:CsbD family protein [Candidatus Devosia euplotis]